MSSREPLWFCHECHAEMRPLMMPDPICASCRGSFVEKMENPEDDPRDFAHSNIADFGEGADAPPGVDTFLLALQGLMDHRREQARSQSPQRTNTETGGGRITLQFRTGNGQRPNVVFSRSSGSSTNASNRPPTMSEFTRGAPNIDDGPTITGPLMAQYLMTLLGHRDPFHEMFGIQEGRMGDYVFNQEALDQIITQLMENSNAHRPVPATEEIMKNLPREVLEENSPTLQKDCAVCKEQFKLETEDPDEQVVVTLPCKHPFHEPCIMPWLKSSGTCPVCRNALVPQPEHHPPAGPSNRNSDTAQRSGSPPRSRSPPPRSSDIEGPDSSGIFQSLFGGLVSNRNESPTRRRSSPHQRSNSDPSARRSQHGHNDGHLPGGWSEDLD